MLIYLPSTVMEHEPLVLSRTISSFLANVNKEERKIKGGSA